MSSRLGIEIRAFVTRGRHARRPVATAARIAGTDGSLLTRKRKLAHRHPATDDSRFRTAHLRHDLAADTALVELHHVAPHFRLTSQEADFRPAATAGPEPPLTPRIIREIRNEVCCRSNAIEDCAEWRRVQFPTGGAPGPTATSRVAQDLVNRRVAVENRADAVLAHRAHAEFAGLLADD